MIAFSWKRNGGDHLLFRDNVLVAALRLNRQDTLRYGQFLWISDIMLRENGGWHAVDFGDVESGKAALEGWVAEAENAQLNVQP